eukprot:gene14842-biopygen11931
MEWQKLSCIVHYKIKESKYSNIKAISDIKKEKLYASKRLREELDGEKNHKDQCNGIPDEIDPNVHGIHLDPCYKKFVKILSDKKVVDSAQGTSTDSNYDQPRPKRIKSSDGFGGGVRGVYPKECNFCHKYRVKRQQKHHLPITVSTHQAVMTIKQAAEANEDQSLFFEIKDLDLIAKEFKYHDFCYKEYTRKEKIRIASTQEDTGEQRSSGNFEAVVQCIKERIIDENQAVSMKVLHDIFELQTDDTRYRSKLKSRIISVFGDQLYFLSVSKNIPEVVVNANAIDSHTLFNDREHIIKQAAQFLREDILRFAKETPALSWPIMTDEVTSTAREPPSSVESFLRDLLTTKDHAKSDHANRLVKSYSADLVHGVTKGKFITAKHFLLGLGLHNTTGQKKPIQIANHFGHCINYNLVCEVETAQAETAQLLATMSGILPVKPATNDNTVLTYFWVDNFDMNIETQTGHGAINSTHMIAFQEESPLTITPQLRIQFERKRNRMLNVPETEPERIIVDAKKEPPRLTGLVSEDNSFDVLPFLTRHFVWTVIRMLNAADQTTSSYSVNMPYVNVTLDVGAAMNALKLIWNFPDQFSNVLIHLGQFHFIKENFAVLGKIVCGSGIEDVIFQADVCSSGSLNGVLSGSHYNRAWTVHGAMSEALERLLFERYCVQTGTNIPEVYNKIANDSDYYEDTIFSNDRFLVKYEEFKEEIRDGKHGITPQFWLSLYIDLMEMQQLAHQAVQENNLDLRVFCWKFFLPFYFALDKQNYARYGSHYVAVLERIENLYPGLKDLLKDKGISVQAQEVYPHRVAVDQRGEQTLNREAKTTGGIKNFAASSSGILKWILNRAEQAKNTNALLSMAEVEASSTLYKPLRPSQVLKTEKFVTNIVKILKEEYLNPFDPNLEKNKLWNLSSGIPTPTTVAENMMHLQQIGKDTYASFRENRIEKADINFHSPIKRTNAKLFRSTNRKVTVTSSNQSKSIEANRNVLGILLAISGRNERAIDFDAALCFPLCPVPLSLANADGSRRITTKSKLQNVLMKYCEKELLHPRESQPSRQNTSTYIIDLMAAIRTLTSIPETYEELTWKFLKSLPTGFFRVDIVADTYRPISLKAGERNKRGSSEKIIIKSPKSKIPRNFSEFLKNGKNKQRLIELMLETVKDNRIQALNMLCCTELFFSIENQCCKFTLSCACREEALSSNQEEADTKIALHCCHALDRYPSKYVVVRSPSADIDILVILLSIMTSQTYVYLDFGTGIHRKGMILSDIEIDECKKSSLIGFHAFTGNDYVSSFFRKGKAACWKVVNNNEKCVATFNSLGSSWNITEETMNGIEEYVCLLYGFRQRNVNAVRKKIFEKKFIQQNKVIDISLLPPCFASLRLHTLRANVIARIWKQADQAIIELPDLAQHGWDAMNEIKWIDRAFPDEIEELLLGDEFEISYEDDEKSEEESDDDD